MKTWSIVFVLAVHLQTEEEAEQYRGTLRAALHHHYGPHQTLVFTYLADLVMRNIKESHT